MYNTITEFMEQPEVKQVPGYEGFKRAVIAMISGAEKETPLPPANCIELTEGSPRNNYRYCPMCGKYLGESGKESKDEGERILKENGED